MFISSPLFDAIDRASIFFSTGQIKKLTSSMSQTELTIDYKARNSISVLWLQI